MRGGEAEGRRGGEEETTRGGAEKMRRGREVERSKSGDE